jgi:hypothetical protein
MPRYYQPSLGILETARFQHMRRQARGQSGLGDAPVAYVPSAAVQAAINPGIPNQGPTLTQTAAVTATMKAAIITASVEVSLAQTVTSAAVDAVISAATTAAAGGAAAVAAAGTTAAAAALSAGSVIPIVGWVFDVLVIIGEAIASESAKRQIRFVIQETKDHINAYAQQIQAQISSEQQAIGEQLYPQGQALAASNQALGGLDGLPDWARQLVSKFQVESIKQVGDLLAETGIIGATLVGDKRGEALAKKKKKQFDDNSDRVQAMFSGKLKNPYRMFADGIDDIGRTLGGMQGVHVVNQKCQQLEAAAKADLDNWKTQTEATLNSADYQQAVVTNIAKALRGDPAFVATATQYVANNKMMVAYFDGLDGTATKATGAGALVATLGSVAAALWLFRR